MRALKILLVGSVLALAPQVGVAKDCRESLYSGSNAALLTGRYLDVAKDNAVLSWGARVLASVGPDYVDWANARDKSFHCVKQGRLHKCTAQARPCTK